jgi:excinuclease UvrABC nuclease subunit
VSTFTWAHVLYRLYDAAGALLYVGITRSIGQRLQDHSQNQPWWPEVADCRVEFLPNRAALHAAELLAIKVEHPRYNLQHQRVQAVPPPGLRSYAKVTWVRQETWYMADGEGHVWRDFDL